MIVNGLISIFINIKSICDEKNQSSIFIFFDKNHENSIKEINFNWKYCSKIVSL